MPVIERLCLFERIFPVGARFPGWFYYRRFDRFEDRMQTIDLPGATITMIDEDILLFEAKANTIVDKIAARKFYDEIEKHVVNDYSLIINRRHRYQLLRFEVFGVINSQSRLKAVAIVADGHAAQKMIELEAPLCEKPFAAFTSIDQALAWLRSLGW